MFYPNERTLGEEALCSVSVLQPDKDRATPEGGVVAGWHLKMPATPSRPVTCACPSYALNKWHQNDLSRQVGFWARQGETA